MTRHPSTLSVEQAAALLALDPAGAEEWARGFLRAKPNDPRAVLIMASARRRRGDPEAAHRMLTPLAQAYPKAANTQYELGATLAALGRTTEAVAALRRATTLNPDLPEAWRALGEQLFQEGEIAAAEVAFGEQLRASVQNPALKPAARALSLGDFSKAETELRAHLIAHPRETEALHLMGETLARLGRFSDAEVVLAHCLALDASQDGARFAYASALVHQQKASEALSQAERLLRQNPGDAAYLNLLAACLGLTGDDERVLEIYRLLLAQYPKQPRVWLNYGHALRTVGKSDDAMAAYRKCIALAPGLGDAYWSLANLKVAAFAPEEEAAMLAQIDSPDLGADDRLHLHYALGKALEDRGDYASSFDHYRQAAHLRRRSVQYDADETTALTQRCKALFTSEFFSSRRNSGSTSCAPIFVVGLPRSGSTLIEQILASHSQVEGTRELPAIGFLARDLGWMRGNAAENSYPESVAHLDLASFASMGETYLEQTRIHRRLGRPFFVDKMPNNFQHIGLIHLIFPQAKIIDARRHPLGACFSAFKQHFAQGQAFSYDLTDIGRYYRDYIDLMTHFNRVLPGRIHRVNYEDLVDDTEGIVRDLLSYMCLPFERGCLRFYQNARSVRTVSSEQVRRPIYRESIRQWQHYEPWLGPLKDALGPALQNWRVA